MDVCMYARYKHAHVQVQKPTLLQQNNLNHIPTFLHKHTHVCEKLKRLDAMQMTTCQKPERKESEFSARYVSTERKESELSVMYLLQK